MVIEELFFLRVLVTGGAGFIGSHIVDRLLSEGNEVLIVDDLSSGSTDNIPSDVKLEVLDITDDSFLSLATSFRPDAMVHCAAHANVPGSVQNPGLDASTNILGGINVCQAAIKSGCSQFVYLNTGGALYGKLEDVPCEEDHPIRPISPYGLSKWTLEQYLPILLPSSISVKVLRLGNVYGPRQDPDGEAGVVAIFGKKMLRAEPIAIFGDGEQTRDFIHVRDVARAIELALKIDSSVTVNISTGVGVTLNELVDILGSRTKYSLQPTYLPERAGDVKHVVLANGRAAKELGWAPQTELLDGVHSTMTWMEQVELSQAP